ncbi:preprotein translocase subunit SecE [Actinosynnema sp. CA-299493]|uniref:Protein translocase subunit SecE n=1 Tax=Saccharothrix texasensis TaxID=103734 RepID=A0A3N1HC20_9PSEU|nr:MULTISPECIES: preprotein translocase subunit SecE [Saccharothrix]QQQ75995.1 preprotein translocase subunit SecE [Saccharothrix sp. 6-C]ROP39832.1 preprotein translocase subunit SecE [Saccharothrix texasensis]
MSEGREQDQPEEREGASRPVTAAARRERRGSARPAGRKDSVEAKKAAEADSDAEEAKKGRPTRSRADSEKRVGFFARIVRYIREVVSELRKVIWPTRKQMITYTGVVLVFVAFMVALVFGLDTAFAWGMFRVFG